MRPLLVVTLVLSAAPALAQGGGDLAPPPEVGAPASPPVAEGPAAPPPEGSVAGDPPASSAASAPAGAPLTGAPDLGAVPAPPGAPPPPAAAPQHSGWERPPRYIVVRSLEDERRATRRQRALEARDLRIASRSERPWRGRIGFFVTGTPRAENGFGPYDDDDRWAYAGLGLVGTLSRWVALRARVDLNAGLAYVFGDYWSNGDHGAEGTLGAAFTLHNRGKRFRFGGGLGADLVMARERDEATGGRFGWTGFRFGPVLELGWFSVKERGVSVRVQPTFTWAPYATGLAPGVVFGAGVEI